jgi:two-component system response regulator RstA
MLAVFGQRGSCQRGIPGAMARVLLIEDDAASADWMLPGLDGISVCRQARERWRGPILMLTARTDEVDEVVALEVGVDDFVAKPIRPRVLLARMRALLRRNGPADDRIVLGELVVDPGSRAASVRGRPIALTTAEFDLLWALARDAGRPVERDARYRELRGIEWDGLDRSMDMRVSQLRKRLREADPTWDDPIRTVRGVGYQLVRP